MINEEKKQLTYAKTRELFAEFIKRYGSTNCRELLNGLDLNDPEDHKKIIEQRLFDIKCEKYSEIAKQSDQQNQSFPLSEAKVSRKCSTQRSNISRICRADQKQKKVTSAWLNTL